MIRQQGLKIYVPPCMKHKFVFKNILALLLLKYITALEYHAIKQNELCHSEKVISISIQKGSSSGNPDVGHVDFSSPALCI